jgi:putative DNA primase/helicase
MNQTFNIYRGSGSNGKSMLTQLMSLALGQYKGTVPITLVTEKRGNIGGTSSEVIQLKGIRYAVMQEPSKEVKLNEGIMKELTGGDPIQARALYAESETFMPQFKLVVCTNSLFEINSNDDGTWRRIRICDFLSKFVGEKETHTDDATAHIFPKDKDLEEKLPKWAPVFASMLVERLLKTKGHVDDCDIVQASSNRYRQGQDHISAYVDEMIIKTGIITDKVRKGELTNDFKQWFQNSQGVRKQPKGIELYEYMDKKFGKCKGTGYWPGIKIKYDTNKDDMDEIYEE